MASQILWPRIGAEVPGLLNHFYIYIYIYICIYCMLCVYIYTRIYIYIMLCILIIYIYRCVMYSSIVIFAHNVGCVNAHSYWRPPAGQSLIVFSLSISSPSYAKVKLSWAWTIQRKPTDRSLSHPPKKGYPWPKFWFPQGYWPQKKLALRGHSLFFWGCCHATILFRVALDFHVLGW